MDELSAAADQIGRKLRGASATAFGDWLRDTVGAVRLRNPSLAEALAGLGSPIFTTVFDGLIEQATGLPSLTWVDRKRAARLTAGQAAVVHLCGYWQRPETVELASWADAAWLNTTGRVLRDATGAKPLLLISGDRALDGPAFDQVLQWADSPHSSRRAFLLVCRTSASIPALRTPFGPANMPILELDGQSELLDLLSRLSGRALEALGLPDAPSPAREWLMEGLSSGKARVLLDALDEAPPPLKATLLRRLEALAPDTAFGQALLGWLVARLCWAQQDGSFGPSGRVLGEVRLADVEPRWTGERTLLVRVALEADALPRERGLYPMYNLFEA